MDLLIPEMSCGHCRAAVTEAVIALDPKAQVAVDLENRRASLQTSATPEAVLAALQEVGFEAKFL